MNTQGINSIFIVGCGGIGSLVAKQWLTRGVEVFALARSQAAANQLQNQGIVPISGNLDQPNSLTELPLAQSWIYYFAPPPPSGTMDPRVRSFTQVLDRIPEQPTGIVYISTSGIYGNHKGKWVDEETEPSPIADRAKRRLDAEHSLLEYGQRKGIPVVILRVGGIYGPDRLPIKRLEQGLPVLSLAQSSYTNRIHADDLVAACIAAVEKGGTGRIYNICDDEPSSMTDYFFAVADHLGLARPPEVGLEEAKRVMSAPMLSYLTESRRMRNKRMHEELGIKLKYPDLASGLAHINPQ